MRKKGPEDNLQPQYRLRAVLLAIWAIAFCIRLIYLWQIHDAPFFDLRIGDAQAYHLWAQRIAGGAWIGSDVFYQAPLYPYFLAVIYTVFDDSVLTVRLIQALMGATSCALLAFAGVSLFGRRGAIAGLLLAIYPPAIFLDGLLEKSSLVTFLTAALLALLAIPAARMTARRWILAGATLGLLSLTRENALLLAVPILIWIVVSQKSPRTGLFFAAGCALVLLPVGLRNLAVAGEFHLTTSQFGPNFYIGNHAGASGGYEALVVGHGSAIDERDDATRLAEQAVGRRLSPGEISSFWAGKSFDYIRSQPGDWLKLMLRKLALTFHADEAADSESPENYAEWSWLLRVLGPFDFGLLLGLAALGAALTAGSWRRLWIFYAVIAAYALSVVMFYVFARYRFPLAPALMLLAAGGIAQASDLMRLRRFRTLALPGAAAIVALALAHLPVADGRTARATHYFNIATELAKDPQRGDQAMAFYQRALGVDPRSPAAHAGLGRLLVAMGRPEEAISHSRDALAAWPDYQEARYNLGVALSATGRAEEAMQAFTEALRIRPDDADSHLGLGQTLLAMQRPEAALDQYRQALALRPRDVKALVGVGAILGQLGRTEEAIPNFRSALEIDPNNAAATNNLGGALASEGRIAEALPYLERAVALNPSDANATRNLEQARRILSQTRR